MQPTTYMILRHVENRRRRGDAAPAAVQSDSPIAVEVDALTAQRAAEVSRHSDVAAVAPAVPMKLIAPVSLAGAANPASTSSAWGIQAVAADTSPFSGDGVKVAVLDTGIDASHPAFRGVELVRRNFTSESDEDVHGHGTHCAGTIFGRDVSGVRIGVAPGVRTALIGKVLGRGGGGSNLVVDAIEWALQNGAQVISMSLAWIDEAMKAWSDDDYGKVAVLAPLAVEHLGKAVLWSENPVLVVPLTAEAESALFGLATDPKLADPKLRTVGLAILLRRLESLLGGLPIDKRQRTRMVEVRNGAMHVGAPAQSRHVLLDSLAVCNLMLEKLGRKPKHFYRDHHVSVQALMDQKRTEVGHRVRAKRARARRHLTELEERLGSDVFAEATDRLAEEAPETLDAFLDPGVWAVDRDCPECGSLGRLHGPIDVDPIIDFEVEPLGNGEYETSPYSPGWEVTLAPTGFACNVCRLGLNGTQELAECSLPAFRHEVAIDDLGDDFDPELAAEQLYGIGD